MNPADTTTSQDWLAPRDGKAVVVGGADLAEMVAEGIERQAGATRTQAAAAEQARGLRWESAAEKPMRGLRWDSSSVDLYEAAQAERAAARARTKTRGSLFAKIASLGLIAQMGVGAAAASTVVAVSTEGGRELVATVVEAATPLEFSSNDAAESPEADGDTSVTAKTDPQPQTEVTTELVVDESPVIEAPEVVEVEGARDEAISERQDVKRETKEAFEAARSTLQDVKQSPTATKAEIAAAKAEVKIVRAVGHAEVAAAKAATITAIAAPPGEQVRDEDAKDAAKADEDAAKAAAKAEKAAEDAARDAEKAAVKAAEDAEMAAEDAEKAAEDAAKAAEKAAEDAEKVAEDAEKVAEDAAKAAEKAAEDAAADAAKAAEEVAKAARIDA